MMTGDRYTGYALDTASGSIGSRQRGSQQAGGSELEELSDGAQEIMTSPEVPNRPRHSAREPTAPYTSSSAPPVSSFPIAFFIR
jgi:hypothetical protein